MCVLVIWVGTEQCNVCVVWRGRLRGEGGLRLGDQGAGWRGKSMTMGAGLIALHASRMRWVVSVQAADLLAGSTHMQMM